MPTKLSSSSSPSCQCRTWDEYRAMTFSIDSRQNSVRIVKSSLIPVQSRANWPRSSAGGSFKSPTGVICRSAKSSKKAEICVGVGVCTPPSPEVPDEEPLSETELHKGYLSQLMPDWPATSAS